VGPGTDELRSLRGLADLRGLPALCGRVDHCVSWGRTTRSGVNVIKPFTSVMYECS
jgi:hypothetical protein